MNNENIIYEILVESPDKRLLNQILYDTKFASRKQYVECYSVVKFNDDDNDWSKIFISLIDRRKRDNEMEILINHDENISTEYLFNATCNRGHSYNAIDEDIYSKFRKIPNLKTEIKIYEGSGMNKIPSSIKALRVINRLNKLLDGFKPYTDKDIIICLNNNEIKMYFTKNYACYPMFFII